MSERCHAYVFCREADEARFTDQGFKVLTDWPEKGLVELENERCDPDDLPEDILWWGTYNSLPQQNAHWAWCEGQGISRWDAGEESGFVFQHVGTENQAAELHLFAVWNQGLNRVQRTLDPENHPLL